MRVSVELPDPPQLEPILESLTRQYHDVMEQLLELQREDRVGPILQAIQAQQDQLVAAFRDMMGMMHQGRKQDHDQMQRMVRQDVMKPHQQTSEALLGAIRSLRQSVGSLPDELHQTMSKSMTAQRKTMMKSAPQSSRSNGMGANRIVSKLSEMERSLIDATKRSRSRTFGSNF